MKNMGITGKFSVVVMVQIATLLIVFGASMYSLTKLKASTDETIDNVMMKRVASNRVLQRIYTYSDLLKEMLLNNDKERDAKLSLESDVYIKKVNESFDDLIGFSRGETKVIAQDMKDEFNSLRSVNDKIRDLALANKMEEGYALFLSTAADKEVLIFKGIRKITELATEETELAKKNDLSLFNAVQRLMTLTVIIGLMAGIGLAFVVIKSLKKSIDETVGILSDSANQVASAANQLAASSQTLSASANEQSSFLEETSAAVEEMNSMVGRNSESAKESKLIAQKGVDSVVYGQKVVENMTRSMGEINLANEQVIQQTNECNQQIQEIVDVIKEIGNKTKVINEIVFQTKLLSFNASVEAARAGEYGKGFAVVAEEVGSLAQMSGSAAKDITGLLEGSILKAQSIVNNSKSSIEKIINNTVEKVEAGSKIARDCGEVLHEISKIILDVSQMAQSVSGASDEQARGINEINQAVIQLNKTTQSNASSSEEAASASEELSAQAEKMKIAVDHLARIVKGGNRVHDEPIHHAQERPLVA